MKSRLRKLTYSLAIAFTIFFATLGFAYARAGGGESFGGGGFDSGSSSGSFDYSSGSSSSGAFTGGSNSFGSCCSIVILIAIVAIIIFTSRKGPKNPGSGSTASNSSSSSNSSMTSEENKASLDKLKETDPKFDEQKFKTHTKKVFMAVQEGWTDRDQKVCRPFMAEEIYQSHQMQINGMKKAKIINVLENIVVGSTAIARIDLGDEYHKITVKVRASMKDYKVNEDDLRKVVEGGKNQSPPFTEYWTFIRKSNLRTKVKNGVFDRKCPNCGAPIKVDVSGVCKYCDANVVNGDYDWVLSEIIQKSEWNE